MLTEEQIARFDPCDATLGNLVLFVIQIKQVTDAYIHNFRSCPEPEWLGPKLREAEAELAVRLRAEKERRLRQLKAQREILLPREEKRKNVDVEITQLEQELANN